MLSVCDSYRDETLPHVSNCSLPGEFVTAGPVEDLVPLVKEMEDLMAKATAAVKVVPPQAQRRPSRRASLIEPNVQPDAGH